MQAQDPLGHVHGSVITLSNQAQPA
jgi:hypothetical protein